MATDGVSQGKSKAIWDPKSHEIWVNLIVEQVRVGNRSGTHLSKQERQIWDALVRGETWLGWNVERQIIKATNGWWEAKLQVDYLNSKAAKFQIKDLDHAFMLDELFRDVTVTGARAWAPTSDDIVLVDSTNSEEVNHDEIGCSDRLEKIPPRRTQLKKLTKQLDEICEAVKNKDSYIHIDPPSCSVQEVLNKLATLPGCQPMSPLFKLGIRLFTKKKKKEQIERFLLL
ncbi:hypothetical protein KPL71_017387 [Citrus sinensis]|uniref:Uncharacterized protein n=1 Tax=Citrus sinensis TaxID=2711 RepID=A0ACB8JNT1_CITSI|nr:hypothetical protein KPL71_017387 [Citrus sinensis]